MIKDKELHGSALTGDISEKVMCIIKKCKQDAYDKEYDVPDKYHYNITSIRSDNIGRLDIVVHRNFPSPGAKTSFLNIKIVMDLFDKKVKRIDLEYNHQLGHCISIDEYNRSFNDNAMNMINMHLQNIVNELEKEIIDLGTLTAEWM